jgi:hypothetical protein
MSFASKTAILIIYFRDITATSGIPIAVLVHRDGRGPETHVRKDWRPVLAYDEGADLEFLQSFVREHVPTLRRDVSALATLLGAENSIRAEKLVGTDSLFDERLADVLRGL